MAGYRALFRARVRDHVASALSGGGANRLAVEASLFARHAPQAANAAEKATMLTPKPVSDPGGAVFRMPGLKCGRWLFGSWRMGWTSHACQVLARDQRKGSAAANAARMAGPRWPRHPPFFRKGTPRRAGPAVVTGTIACPAQALPL